MQKGTYVHDSDELILVNDGVFGQFLSNSGQSAFKVVPLTREFALHFFIECHLGDLQAYYFRLCLDANHSLSFSHNFSILYLA